VCGASLSCCFPLSVMEVLSGSRQRLKKQQQQQPSRQNKSEEVESAAVSKSLSSTYRSFRDSDVSLQSFHLAGDTSISVGLSHKSLTLTDIPEWTRRENSLHNNNNNNSKNNKKRSSSSYSIDTLHRSQSSILSTNTLKSTKSERSEIVVEGLLSCCSSPEPPGSWPLVHRCLRTLSHGHWFHHWRKSSSSSFFSSPLALHSSTSASYFRAHTTSVLGKLSDKFGNDIFLFLFCFFCFFSFLKLSLFVLFRYRRRRRTTHNFDIPLLDCMRAREPFSKNKKYCLSTHCGECQKKTKS
jgi:hypothetical protein